MMTSMYAGQERMNCKAEIGNGEESGGRKICLPNLEEFRHTKTKWEARSHMTNVDKNKGVH